MLDSRLSIGGTKKLLFLVSLRKRVRLVALPPRLVAASCACLIGGAALGVARVRAGQPRAAEVATATFAAVGASLAVSAWWLLASGGVGTENNSDERGERVPNIFSSSSLSVGKKSYIFISFFISTSRKK